MISREQHHEIVKRFMAAVSFAEGDCRDIIWSVDGFTRNEVKRIDENARRMKTDRSGFMRESIIREMRRQGQSVDEAEISNAEQPWLRPAETRAFKRAMRGARVFEVPTGVFRSLLAEGRKLAEREISALIEEGLGPGRTAEHRRLYDEFLSGDLSGNTTEDEVFNRFFAERHSQVDLLPVASFSFPDKRPFDSCVFMPPEVFELGDAIETAIELRIKGKPKCMGILVDSQISAILVGVEEDSYMDFRPMILRWEGKWTRLGFTSYHLVDAFVRLVNEFTKAYEEQPRLASKLLFEKLRKGRKISMPIPPPFYVVNLSDAFVKENRRGFFPSRSRDWKHRWDVRGHSVLRYRRGRLPIDPKVERDLRRRKYKIWTLEQPDAEIFIELARRRVEPQRVGEWLATLVVWRDDFVKGPEGKPYVPAVHRVPDQGG